MLGIDLGLAICKVASPIVLQLRGPQTFKTGSSSLSFRSLEG